MLLICHYKDVPSPRMIYGKLQDFKQTWDCEKTWYFDHIEEYQEQPQHLPKQVYEHAYAEDGPVTMHFAGINTVAAVVPLRANSKLMKKARTRAEAEALEAVYHEDSRPQRSASKSLKCSLSSSIKDGPTDTPGSDTHDSMTDLEVKLRQEYEQKLAQLRTEHTPAKQKPPRSNAQNVHGRLVVVRQPDGSLQLESPSTDKVQRPVKEEPQETVQHPAKDEPQNHAGASAPTIADLDP